MGLWDRLRRALGLMPAGEAPAPRPAPEPAVRRHHYQFAHRALPQIAFGDVERFLFDLDQDGTRLLNEIWRFVGTRLIELGEAAMSADIKAHRLQLGATAMWVATLPRPVATPEAALVAFVRGERGKPERLRYFTLEYGEDADNGAAFHVLCEWVGEEQHSNTGLVVPPTVDALAHAVLSQTQLRN